MNKTKKTKSIKKPNINAFSISSTDIKEVFGKNFGDMNKKHICNNIDDTQCDLQSETKIRRELYIIQQIILIILTKLGAHPTFIEDDIYSILQIIENNLSMCDSGKIFDNYLIDNQSKVNRILEEMIDAQLICTSPFIDCNIKFLPLENADLTCINAEHYVIIMYSMSKWMI